MKFVKNEVEQNPFEDQLDHDAGGAGLFLEAAFDSLVSGEAVPDWVLRKCTELTSDLLIYYHAFEN